MNWSTHVLHITWPQGTVSMALLATERPFLQDGQMKEARSSGEALGLVDLGFDGLAVSGVLKVTAIRYLRESGWGDCRLEAGHIG